jgi:hypothetical protein
MTDRRGGQDLSVKKQQPATRDDIDHVIAGNLFPQQPNT